MITRLPSSVPLSPAAATSWVTEKLAQGILDAAPRRLDPALNAARIQRFAPFMAVGRANAQLQPVYVGDVVATICAELDSEHNGTKAIQLCGPDVYTLRELVQYTASVLGLRRLVLGLPDTLAKIQGVVMGALPGQAFTLDNYRSLLTDSVCRDGCPPQATSVDQVVPSYLGKTDEQTHLQALRRRARR